MRHFKKFIHAWAIRNINRSNRPSERRINILGRRLCSASPLWIAAFVSAFLLFQGACIFPFEPLTLPAAAPCLMSILQSLHPLSLKKYGLVEYNADIFIGKEQVVVKFFYPCYGCKFSRFVQCLQAFRISKSHFSL